MKLGCSRNYVFYLFLEGIKYASCTSISSSKSAASGPNWLKFEEVVIRTFADNTVSVNSDYSPH